MQPHVTTPAIRPNIAASRQKAAERARVLRGWYEHSMMGLADYQRGRYYFGYGAMPAIIRSDPRTPGIPRWEVRSPMGVLPGPRDLRYSPEIPDCFVATTQSARWVWDNYGASFGSKVHDDTMLEVVEYVDAEQCTVFCTGPAAGEPYRDTSYLGSFGSGTYGGYWSERGTHIERLTGPAGEGRGWLVMLSSTPNLAETCTASYPGVISLSKVEGFVNGILSRHKLHARMMALTTKAIMKGIFPNEWVILDPDRQGAGTPPVMADGMRGVVGVLDGGQVVLNQISPGYQTMPFLDRLEAYSRSDAGILAEFGGESGVGIRTRARGAAVEEAAVDPSIQEAHEIAETAREVENRIAIAVAKGYGGSRPRSFFITEGRAKTALTYTATDLFDIDATSVKYAVAGADRQALIIILGQSVATSMMSKHEARVLHPDVVDVEDTERRLRLEALEDVVLGTLVQIGQASPDDLSYAVELAEEGKTAGAILRAVQRRAQERQATAGAPGEPTGPAEPGSPEAQAGLGEPGVASVPETVAAPPQSLSNLASLVVQTRNSARPVARSA